MRHWHAIVLFALGLATAGAFSGVVIADVTTSTSTASTTTAVTTTAATTTTATTTTARTTTTTTRRAPARPATIPAGVRVAGVRVGGLRPSVAVAAVRAAYARPLAVVVDRNRLELDPTRYASAYTPTAVARARVAARGANVDLVVAVRGAAVRAWVAAVHRRFERASLDATLHLRNGRPVITKERVGRTVDAKRLTQRVIAALRANTRLPLRVHTAVVAPAVSAAAFSKVIVINRSINRLYLFTAANLWRTFPVATGQAIYPTPRGEWHIVVKYKNPWWYPPTQDDWAKGLKPVPPGPGNPLGTRWMGLSAPGVGIHGTDSPTSIGYSASHGCVRMQVPDSEWLFDHVDIGTTVFVV
jgi:lipoprotein-anchoring transpeptidase ErfK/SrfK